MPANSEKYSKNIDITDAGGFIAIGYMIQAN